MPDLTILHTNDLHGKLSRRAEDAITREKSSPERCLLLDAGDAVSSGNVYYRPGGEPILARMSDLGYDAMTMGNREFHVFGAGLKSKVKLARFPVLSANLRSKNDDLGRCVVPSVSWDLDGLKVIVFGLTVPMITARMLSSKISPFWFDDPIEAAKEIVPELRSRADVLIALTHIGLRSDVKLADAVDGIDLVVGGHNHVALAEPRMIGDTAVVQAGCWGSSLGKVELSLAGKASARWVVHGSLIDPNSPD